MLAAVAERTGYLTHRAARRQVKRSGEVFLADIVTQDVRFEGRAARLSLTIDISERVRMQELVRQREQLFAALVDHSPDIISRLDRGLRHKRGRRPANSSFRSRECCWIWSKPPSLALSKD